MLKVGGGKQTDRQAARQASGQGSAGEEFSSGTKHGSVG